VDSYGTADQNLVAERARISSDFCLIEMAAAGPADHSGPRTLEIDQLIGFSGVLILFWFWEQTCGFISGFAGAIPEGLVLHPSQRYHIYPLGSTVVIRDVNDPSNQYFLQGHSDRVSAIAVSHNGKLLATGQVTHLGFQVRISFLFDCSEQNNAHVFAFLLIQADIIVWDFDTRDIVYRLTLHKAKVQSLAFSASDNYLASLGGQDDNSLVVWNVHTGKAICGSPAANDTTLTVKWANTNEDTLVTAGVGNVRVWQLDLQNRKVRPTDCALGHLKRNTLSVVIDPADEFFYCGTDSGDVLQVWFSQKMFPHDVPCSCSLQLNLPRRLYKDSGPAKARFSKGIQSLALTPGGDLIMGGGDGTLAVVKRDGLKMLRCVLFCFVCRSEFHLSLLMPCRDVNGSLGSLIWF
jgi:WD40 repeat protein